MPYMGMRDGTTLHYLDVGHGEPCVLLHGFAMHGVMWLPFVAPLLRRYRFILPDLRGWGLSHGLALQRSDAICQHADDLADLLDGLALERVHLAGLSMGACAAMEYLERHGTARIAAYMNIDQSPCIPNGPDWQYGLMGVDQPAFFEAWRGLIDRIGPWQARSFGRLPHSMRRQLFRRLSEFLAATFYRSTWRALRFPARHELAMRCVMPTSNWPIYISTITAFVNGTHDWRASLARVDVPVTVLVGAESVLYPAAGQARIVDYAPHARVVRVPKSGHAVPFDAPRRFVHELGCFLGRDCSASVSVLARGMAVA